MKIERLIRRPGLLLSVLGLCLPGPALLVPASLVAFPVTGGEVHGEERAETSAAVEALEILRASQIAEDSYLASPRLLRETPGAPEQMIWIEGTEPTRTRVRASRRVGGSWSSPVTVEDFGPGSRAGLHAVRLPSGDVLAAWAAFDGTDDEIRWSRWTATDGWSPPRNLTNDAYPDVTPRLVALGDGSEGSVGGALLAWSGYDGEDYRISLARWIGDGFEELPGPAGRGAARPHFQRIDSQEMDGDVFLVWRQAVPRGWGMAAVGEADGIVRTTLAPITDPRAAETPRIVRETPEGLILEAGVSVPWTDQKTDR